MRTQYPLTDIAPVRNPRRRAPRFWPRGNRPMRRSFDELRASSSDRLLPGSATAARTWTSVGEAAERVLSRTGFVPVTPGVREGWAPIAPDITGISGLVAPLPEDLLRSLFERSIGAGPDARRVQYSISTPRLYHAERLDEPGWGTTRQIARDIDNLGCDAIWHPGRLQLLLRNFFPDGIPRDDTGTAIRAAVKSSTLLADLEAFVRDLHSEGLQFKLYITWLTLGAGNSAAVDIPDPLGERIKPLVIEWADDHNVGESELIADDGTRYDFWNGLGEPHPWHSRTMDPTNGYKLQYYRWMSQAFGEWLAERRDALLADGIDLADYIGAIELGNELSTRHCYESGPSGKGNEGDADAWARFYYWCSTGIWEGADWVPMMLPAIASYDEKSDLFNARWEGKFGFLNAVMNSLSFSVGRNLLGYALAPTLKELVRGLDYHCYHHLGRDTQPILFMQADLISLRRLLDSYLPDDQDPAVLTMQECGFNVVCDRPVDDATPTGSGYDSGCEAAGTRTDDVPAYPEFENPLPTDGSSPSTLAPSYRFPHVYHSWSGVGPGPGRLSYVGALDYQAVALWCRLALASASGAEVVGWHSLMAAPSGAFAGVGLRRDQHPSRASMSDVAVARQRAAYHAFQRLVQSLGPYSQAEALRAPDLTPLPDDGTVDLHAKWATATPQAAHHVFVLHFSEPKGFVVWPHVYLCFADPHGTHPDLLGTTSIPYLSGDPGIVSARLRLGSASGVGDFTVQVQSTQPVGATSTGGDGLPGSEWDTSTSVPQRITTTGPLQLILTRSAYPFLVRSPHALRIQELHAAPSSS